MKTTCGGKVVDYNLQGTPSFRLGFGKRLFWGIAICQNFWQLCLSLLAMLALSIKNICSKPTSSTCCIIKEECFVLDPSKISVIPRARLSLLWRSDNWQDSLRDVQPHKSQIQLTPSDEAVKWRLMRKYLWHLFIPKVLTRRAKIWVFFVIFQFFRRDLWRGWTVNCEVFAQLQIFST